MPDEGLPESRPTRRKRLNGLHINKMIPNALTLLAICAGLSAIRYAFEDKWEPAAVAILVAAILDGLDGRVARILKGASKFGAELDSLSDFICFGVAPTIMLYLWAAQDAGRFGWMLSMLFPVCMALRLARFNTALEDENQPTWKRNFFTGVPAPAGAGLVLLPMILSFQVGEEWVRRPEVVCLFLLVVAGLLVSAIPTFSFKKVKVEQRWVLPGMLLVGLVAAGIISAPWLTLSMILAAYLISIPFSIRAHSGFKKRDAAG